MNHLKRLQHLIFVSTCSNYGFIEGSQLADEEHELNPMSIYSKSKVVAEKYIMELEDKVDYLATILRFATAFGLACNATLARYVSQDIFVSRFFNDCSSDDERVALR